MKSVVELKVKANAIRNYQNGYLLITKDTIKNVEVLKEEGNIVHLTDDSNQFIAKGYYGKQNKGIGWILTRNKNTKIDYSFFKNKILIAINKRQSYYDDLQTNAFRIFNGEGDGVGGFTIDYYDGYYVINWYSEGIYAYKEQVIRVLDELGDYKAIYEKKRFDTKGQ
ncbi:RlmI/RlmK family 23S rRNA methyltransferase, partial [Virgibacillus halodenitrificans]|nr:RlmI/RlmK family 23S rRNA methyltransferase [Virgibacillus halodenitrificans]